MVLPNLLRHASEYLCPYVYIYGFQSFTQVVRENTCNLTSSIVKLVRRKTFPFRRHTGFIHFEGLRAEKSTVGGPSTQTLGDPSLGEHPVCVQPAGLAIWARKGLSPFLGHSSVSATPASRHPPALSPTHSFSQRRCPGPRASTSEGTGQVCPDTQAPQQERGPQTQHTRLEAASLAEGERACRRRAQARPAGTPGTHCREGHRWEAQPEMPAHHSRDVRSTRREGGCFP